MTDGEQAELVKLLTIIELRLRAMPRTRADGTPKSAEEIRREVWQWLRTAAVRTDGPAH